MKPRHQEKIAEDVDHTGHQNEQKRRFAVAQASKNSGKEVIGHNKENAASADANIAHGKIQRFFGSLHQDGNGPGKTHQKNAQPHRDQRKHQGAAPQKRSDLFRPFFAQIPCDQNGNAHGELCYHKSD